MPHFKQIHIPIWLAIPLLVWWALRGIAIQEVASILRSIRFEALLVLAFLNIAIALLFSIRWWLALRALDHPVPYLKLSAYRLAGFGVTYFTPGPQFGGEPVQVNLLKQRRGIPGPVSVTSVMVDKLLELSANFSFMLAGVIWMVMAGFAGKLPAVHIITLAGILVALPLVYLLALWRGATPLGSILGRFISENCQISTIEKLLHTASSAEFQAMRLCRGQPAQILLALFLSVIIWFLMIYEYWLVVNLLGFAMSLTQTMVALTAARLAFLLPMPAGLGSLEASQVLAMNALGFDPALGIGVSLVIRTRDVLFAVTGLALLGHLSRARTVKTQASQAVGQL
jgi:glycosyltransferase 2 family protein